MNFLKMSTPKALPLVISTPSMVLMAAAITATITTAPKTFGKNSSTMAGNTSSGLLRNWSPK